MHNDDRQDLITTIDAPEVPTTPEAAEELDSEAATPATEAPEAPTSPEAREPAPVVTTPPAEAPEAPDEVRAAPPLPAELPILPLRGQVVFPFHAQPLLIGQERSIKLIDDAMHGERLIGLVGQANVEVEQVPPEELATVGVAARILQLLRRPDGTMMIAVQGLQRIRVGPYTSTTPYLTARVEEYPDIEETSLEVEALKRNVVGQFQRLATLSQIPEELVTAAMNIEDARQLGYLVGGYLPRIDMAQRQALLEAPSVRGRLEALSAILTHELEVLELGQKIQGQAQEEMGKAQREYFLREQLKAIQKELGEQDETQAEIGQLRERIEAAGLPPEARKEADRELGRMERLSSASPEHSVIRTYLDWMISLPWSKGTSGTIDVAAAEEILNADHYGLDKIKDRILEYLAVRKMKQDQAAALAAEGEVTLPTPGDPAQREPILCLVGPPGVGKTSLGHSIARALGRTFTRMSLGGIRDESEIRGHRRTYIGAMPGRFIQALRRAETNDPVIMLDEIDKVGADWRGDPSSALLEVLDPEQNKDFRDNYLDVQFDLSRVMFIATANTMDSIPAPLLDRMEILQLSGYTEEEKVHIATRYLVPKELRANGLTSAQLTLEEGALRAIIGGYTREAGVRGLERQIGTVCRKVARRFAEKTQDGAATVTGAQVGDYLGRQTYHAEAAERTDRPGVATGLVWTPVGGDIIFIEAATVPGEERLILTGQLGDVMKESAQAALTCARTYTQELGVDTSAWRDAVLHLHVPAGAVPKDGPSAGVTMATAIASLMTGRAVRSDVAMTGEITLRGKVLPVGGVKEKVLAAHRAGLRTVILPKRNAADLDDLPADLRAELTVVPVDDIREVWEAALTKATVAAVA